MRRNQAIVMSGFARPYGSGEVAYSLASKAAIAAKASKQVARAIAGSSLSDYRSAEDLSSFWYAPTSVETAYWKAAYWLAVASRLGGSGLAASASAAMAKGNAVLSPIGFAASSFLASPDGIMRDAGEKVASVAGGNKQLVAVARILGVQTTQVAAAQERAYDQSWVGILTDTAGRTAGQIAGTQKRPWYFWPAVIGIPLVILLVFGKALGWHGRVKSIASDVQRRAKAAVTAAST